jgi:hypothetical protein
MKYVVSGGVTTVDDVDVNDSKQTNI